MSCKKQTDVSPCGDGKGHNDAVTEVVCHTCHTPDIQADPLHNVIFT